MDAESLRIEPADLEALSGNRSLLQTPFWAEFRQRMGWKALAFRYRYPSGTGALLVLVRSLPLGQRLAYVAHGPELPEPSEGREDFLIALARALAPHLAGCLFVRFDLPWGSWGYSRAPARLKRGGGLAKAPADIQPPDTVILDLAYAEEALLAAMKSKTRYNIGLAAKKGVRVEEGTLEDLEAWYSLFRETARRDRITLHSYDYYSEQFLLAERVRSPELKLLLARHGGQLLAGIIIALHGEEATYLYGASSDARRNLMPSYALQWEAIRLAKRRGCRTYDLFGIPPSEDPAHPMHGLYRFKTGFGGRLYHRLGCYDYAYRPLGYALYARAERLRLWYYRRLKKGRLA